MPLSRDASSTSQTGALPSSQHVDTDSSASADILPQTINTGYQTAVFSAPRLKSILRATLIQINKLFNVVILSLVSLLSLLTSYFRFQFFSYLNSFPVFILVSVIITSFCSIYKRTECEVCETSAKLLTYQAKISHTYERIAKVPAASRTVRFVLLFTSHLRISVPFQQFSIQTLCLFCSILRNFC